MKVASNNSYIFGEFSNERGKPNEKTELASKDVAMYTSGNGHSNDSFDLHCHNPE